MENESRCQSCGMPVGSHFYGTNFDGSENRDWCTFCFRDGEFTDPDITCEQMIEMSVENMTNDLSLPTDEAEELARSIIPNLRRWLSPEPAN